MWTDIDYMDDYKDWTWDPDNFPQSGMRDFVDSLHAQGQKYVVIVDPGIKNTAGYVSFDEGVQMDAFVKDPQGGYYVGNVWPGDTVFPDFLSQVGRDYWRKQVDRFLQGVPVDGLWIDMNEVSNFKSGSGGDPDYHVNNDNNHDPLGTKAVDVRVLHRDGNRELDVHNLYGLAEAIATREALESVTNKRAFVLSRSSFPGLGAHAGHWTGDNKASWDDLRLSIPGILNFNLYGVPLVGAGESLDLSVIDAARHLRLPRQYQRGALRPLD